MTQENISAKVIAKSYNPSSNSTITTFELEYPRFIHSELMTHRTISRNAASSRAIPTKTTIDMVLSNPAIPVAWGKNQSGMVAENLLDLESENVAKKVWMKASKSAATFAAEMAETGVHKQIVNRIIEPFVRMKTIVTATEYENFFWLRNHKDADPTIAELAKKMLDAHDSFPTEYLFYGHWHLPYVDCKYSGDIQTYSVNGTEIDLETAKKISASCCAQVSYRKLDSTLDKAEAIYERLINGEIVHASPIEHQATPMIKLDNPYDVSQWDAGITHVDREGQLWSGNFRGWIQNRQLIPNNVKMK